MLEYAIGAARVRGCAVARLACLSQSPAAMMTTATWPLSIARDLVALTKPGVTFGNGLVAAAGLVIAPRVPALSEVVALIVGTWLVVASANTFNMVIERERDARMERTRERPCAAGRVSAQVGWLWATVLALLGGGVLFAGTNALTAALGVGAIVAYAFVYTPLKPVTPWALPIGALPGAVPPLLGVVAVTPESPALGLALAAAVFLWQFPHFLAIAVRRREDYARAGIRAWSVVRGERASRSLSRMTALLLVPVGLLPTLLGGAGALAALGLVGLGAWLAWAAWRSEAWVKPTFLVSLIYLPALPIVLALDRIVT